MSSSINFYKNCILNQKILEEINQDYPKSAGNELELITNQFINNVQKNLENFSYNKIIANFHEVYSSINKILDKKIDKNTWIENYNKILIVMSPVIPHFVNECSEILLNKNPKLNKQWPEINKTLLVNEKVNFVVQINGKTRGVLNVKTGISEKELLEKIKCEEKLKKYLKDKNIKKKIFIPNKILNIII